MKKAVQLDSLFFIAAKKKKNYYKNRNEAILNSARRMANFKELEQKRISLGE